MSCQLPVLVLGLGSPVHGNQSQTDLASSSSPSQQPPYTNQPYTTVYLRSITHSINSTTSTMSNIPDADPDEPVETKPFKFVT
ncbi:hypothetical protein ACJ72_08335, partial [Emergomyces africanus]